MTSDLLQRLLLALAIGLLIGVERGWRERDGKPGSRVAGIRTHALISILGAIWGLIGEYSGGVTLGLGALGFTLAFAAFEWREWRKNGDLSATGLVAGILTFALGVYAVKGNMTAAAAAAVVSTCILAERELLHQFIGNLKWVELRDALLLLLMSVVLLPVMPNRTIDPWGAINPFEVWLVTILIAAMSYAGYIAVKVAGAKRGPLFAGLAGALVSSTTVTWTFARLAKQNPAASTSMATGILASWTISLLRMSFLAVAIAPSLFVPLLLPIGAAAAVFLTVAAFLYRSVAKAPDAPLQLEHPFELFAVLRFGLLFVVILVLTKWIASLFGASGLFGLAAISGAADVDPVTISMARAAGKSLAVQSAALFILTAALANLGLKCCLAVGFGGGRFARPLLGAAAVAIAVGALLLP